MANSSALQNAAYDAAKRFLEVIAIVDDGALQHLPTGKKATTPVLSTKIGTTAPTQTTEGQVDAGSPIAYEEISRASVREGIFSALVRPEPLTEEGAGQIAADLVKADIIVLDWRIQGIEDGQFASWIIQRLLVSNPDRKRQVICVYSDFPDPAGALSALAGKLALPDSSVVGSGIQAGALVIVWKAKVNGIPGFSVTEAKDLPRELIQEFASRHTGLVPLVALDSLTAVRLNTLPILERYSDEADLGFSFDSMLLGGTQAVTPSVRQALADDLAVSIEATSTSDVPSLGEIESWLETGFSRDDPLPATVKKANLQASRAHAATLIAGTATESERKAAKSPENRKKIANCFYPAGTFEENETSFLERYARFAALLSTQYWPTTMPCLLGLGTIVEGNAGERWISLQPSCDSVRLTAATKFPLVPIGALPEKPKALISTPIIDGTGLNCFCVPKMANVLGVSFLPDGTREVVLSAEGVFTDVDGTTWRLVGNLRMSHAHRLLQVLTDQSGRIGVSEGELGRKLADSQ